MIAEVPLSSMRGAYRSRSWPSRGPSGSGGTNDPGPFRLRYIFIPLPWWAMVGGMTKLRGNPWAVLLVVSLGFFMTLLDLTIVNIAIPNLITKLHASLDDVLWVINAYALVLAVLV